MAEKVELEQQLAARDQKIKELEEQNRQAAQRALQLEQAAVDSLVAAVVELAQTYRDTEGKALPRQLIEWVGKVLKFEAFGEGAGVVQLSQDMVPGFELRKYLAGAVRALLLSMPGSVPVERQTHGGNNDSNQDAFDYKAEWEGA